jgi:hypothetical protein
MSNPWPNAVQFADQLGLAEGTDAQPATHMDNESLAEFSDMVSWTTPHCLPSSYS